MKMLVNIQTDPMLVSLAKDNPQLELDPHLGQNGNFLYTKRIK